MDLKWFEAGLQGGRSSKSVIMLALVKRFKLRIIHTYSAFQQKGSYQAHGSKFGNLKSILKTHTLDRDKNF